MTKKKEKKVKRGRPLHVTTEGVPGDVCPMQSKKSRRSGRVLTLANSGWCEGCRYFSGFSSFAAVLCAHGQAKSDFHLRRLKVEVVTCPECGQRTMKRLDDGTLWLHGSWRDNEVVKPCPMSNQKMDDAQLTLM